MKKESINSYLTTVYVDGIEVEVQIIDNAHKNIKEEFWSLYEVKSINGGSCLDFYLSTSMDEYQAICRRAKAEASKKWKEFIKR